MIQFDAVKRLWPWSVPLAIIVAYIVIAAIKLRYPGTQYDEALYVNAALGGVDHTTFYTKTFYGLPVLTMPYIGALKSYLFFPIFALFGVSAITMRLPVVLLTAGGLFALYWVVQAQVGRRLSVLIVALTALDASFIMFTRLDNGPVVLDFIIRVLGLLMLLAYARGRAWWQLGLFWLLLLLGTFNKINFIWDVNAFAAGLLLLYGRQLWRTLKRPDFYRAAAISAVGYAMSVGWYVYIDVSYHLGGSFGFVGWTTMHNNLVTLVRGSWFYNYALSPRQIGTDAVFWLMLLIIVAGSAWVTWATWRKHKPAYSPAYVRLLAVTGLLFVLMLGQIVVTKKATAGWHYFSIYPLFGILFVLALVALTQAMWPKRRQLATLSAAVVVGTLCLYQLNLYRQYIALYGKPVSNQIWSSAIYDLSAYAKTRHSPFISLDWGMQTQLLGFDGVHNKYYEVFGPINADDPVQNKFTFQTYIASKPHAYYVAHAPGKEIIPSTAPQFFNLAQTHGLHPVLVKTFYDGGQAIFQVYQLR